MRPAVRATEQVDQERRPAEPPRRQPLPVERVVVLAESVALDQLDDRADDALRLPKRASAGTSSHAVLIHDGPRQHRSRCQPARKLGSSIDTDGIPYRALVRHLVLAPPAGFASRPPPIAAGALAGGAVPARRVIGGPAARSATARRALLWGAIAEPQRLAADDAGMMIRASRGRASASATATAPPRWHTPGLGEVIEQLGIRYLVVNRPGFAGSDPCPDRSVADHARDLDELMTILGYDRFSVGGVSAGAPYALACGWALADRLVGLAAVSPLGPADGPGASPSLRYRVPLVPFGWPRLGPAPAHLSLLALGLRRQTCAQAMIDDYLVCRRPWGFDPAEVEIPVALWHGRGDRLVPLAHTLALAAAIPDCEARVDHRGGHFFYGGRLAEILGPLLPDGAEPIASPALVRAA